MCHWLHSEQTSASIKTGLMKTILKFSSFWQIGTRLEISYSLAGQLVQIKQHTVKLVADSNKNERTENRVVEIQSRTAKATC